MTARVMRLVCSCGRNLSDVTYNKHNPDWTRDSLLVTPRPNVNQSEFRHWEISHDRTGKAWWGDRTYIWSCRCGAVHQRCHESIGITWAKLDTKVGISLVVLGKDL